MNYLYLDHITKYYADKVLFENITLGINKGQKVALIARNGTGKTSLLNVIAALDEPDEGKVQLHPDVRIGYLKQNPDYIEGQTMIQFLLQDHSNPVTKCIQQYEQAVLDHKNLSNQSNQKALQTALEQMDIHHAWDYESDIMQILGKLKLELSGNPIEELSGGQRKRLDLARVILQKPDFMILDEPTNHLDIEMIEWLEKYLQQPNLTLLLITHDRYFLEVICNEIIELEKGNILQFKGNYSYYLEKKEEWVHNQKMNIEKARSLVRQDLDWMRRMPKARGTKAKAKIDRFRKNEKIAGQNISEDKVEFKIDAARMGSKILEIKSVDKRFDDLVILDKFTYNFKRFEKVGIVGNNGTGKTTLLNLITGQLKPDSGTIKIGSTIKMGYFNQENPKQFRGKRVLDIVKDIAEVITLKSGKSMGASQFLTLFQFPPESQFTFYESLSGGEQRRLHLVTVLMSNPNFLILDEPTNDLDLPTLQTLEDFLKEYPGCVIVVSHDRFFMDKIVDHLFVFKGNGKVIDFPGNYTQYRVEVVDHEKTGKSKPVKKETVKSEKPKTKLTFKEKFEYEQLTKDIETLEARKAELTQLLNSGETDHEKLMAWSEEIGKIVTDLETKSDRWLELSEFAG
jgi:ABC transport system ATP-binding/permease protein